MQQKPFLSIGWKDVIKGFITAVFATFITGCYSIIQNGVAMPTSTQWKGIAIASLAAGLAYLLKNVFTNSNDQFLKKEPPKSPETPNVQ